MFCRRFFEHRIFEYDEYHVTAYAEANADDEWLE